MKHDHVTIAVSDARIPGVEHVPARQLPDGKWELIRSPLYATQLAAGDVIAVLDGVTGAFEIVTRGGNVSVQFYLGEHEVDDAVATDKAEKEISAKLASLGGRMDGKTPGLIVYSIPIEAGFPSIESVFEAAVLQHPGAQWQFGNVYDSATGEPLRWWE